MSGDTAALAALVVAVIALVVAAGQLTQQLLATSYILRKCDSIVMGGLIPGGTRQWHWRQFRFSVKYKAIQFELESHVYHALGVTPAISVSQPAHQLLDHAAKVRPKRTSAQACWVSFIQDLAHFDCISHGSLGSSEETGDRVPDDLTVVPVRVDAISVLLTCVAMGMQVYKYNPTEGEISLAGSTGSISCSAHPVLGCLIHYSVTHRDLISHIVSRNSPRKADGRSLRQAGEVWANVVFGRFRDRSYRPQWFALSALRGLKEPLLREQGWPEDSVTDTIGGAACFMVFADVDVSHHQVTSSQT